MTNRKHVINALHPFTFMQLAMDDDDMAGQPDARQLHCTNCGLEATAGDDQWETVTDPALGALTQCPDCTSTNIIQKR